jgi:hypothetical protein
VKQGVCVSLKAHHIACDGSHWCAGGTKHSASESPSALHTACDERRWCACTLCSPAVSGVSAVAPPSHWLLRLQHYVHRVWLACYQPWQAWTMHCLPEVQSQRRAPPRRPTRAPTHVPGGTSPSGIARSNVSVSVPCVYGAPVVEGDRGRAPFCTSGPNGRNGIKRNCRDFACTVLEIL